MYYVYRMSDRMGKKAKLMKDTDRFAKMYGVASIRDAEVYQAILMIDRHVLPRTSNMPKGYYVTIGETMARHIMYMTRIYFNYTDGMIDVSEATICSGIINS